MKNRETLYTYTRTCQCGYKHVRENNREKSCVCRTEGWRCPEHPARQLLALCTKLKKGFFFRNNHKNGMSFLKAPVPRLLLGAELLTRGLALHRRTDTSAQSRAESPWSPLWPFAAHISPWH